MTRVDYNYNKETKKVERTELKTLKDFKRKESEYDEYSDGMKEGNNNLIDELKQEAIKWVKFLDDCLKNRVPPENREHVLGRRVALTSFFNITEEELK